jgi:hypothetical protein
VFTYERPQVSSVTPSSGSTEGGTKVTVAGKYLTGASYVFFGSNAATHIQVQPGGTTLTAVSPAGSGTVDVTVHTPQGGSEATPADHFSYMRPTETSGERGGEEPGSGAGSGAGQGNGSGGTGGGTETPGAGGGSQLASSQVLALGPVVAKACAASLLAKTIAVSHGKLAAFKLVGIGAGSCRGTLRLRARRVLAHHRVLLETIGTATFTVAAGERVTVHVRLTRAGRALLRAHHGHLDASLLIVRSTPAPAQARTASVRLAPAPPAKRPASALEHT